MTFNSRTGEQLSLEMADALLNVVGAAKPTDEDRRKLADYLVMKGLRWVDDRYRIGLRSVREDTV